VETPLAGVKGVAQRTLSSVSFDRVYDAAGFHERIDARHSLAVPDCPLCELAEVEHGLVDEFLMDARRWGSLEWYLAGGLDRRFMSEHAVTRMFRRSQPEKEFFLQWDFEDAEAGGWKEMQWDKAAKQNRILDPPSVPMARLQDDAIAHPDVIWAVDVDLKELLADLRRYFPVMTDLAYSASLLGFSILNKDRGTLEGSIMTGMDWARPQG
jgi:hypothetical protein